jgi:uncharacterized protein (DUF58 family)
MPVCSRSRTYPRHSCTEAYLERLADRRDKLERLSRKTGWRFLPHTTAQSAQTAMLWIYQALEVGR